MEHAFSIEMKSRKHVKQICMSNKCQHCVLFEGHLGKLNKLSFVDGAVLEIKGTNGILRIDLSEDELQKVLLQRKAIQRTKEDHKKITCGPGEI